VIEQSGHVIVFRDVGGQRGRRQGKRAAS